MSTPSHPDFFHDQDGSPRTTGFEFASDSRIRRLDLDEVVTKPGLPQFVVASPEADITTGFQPESDTGAQVILEPVAPDTYDLSYACLLIPRFSSHFLVGDLDKDLHVWLKEICISYGWRLDFMAIRPHYLQWILHVPPSIPPSYFMRVVRHQTSRKIFTDYPRFKRENLSKDFWAPGYLVLVSASPHPAEMINEYIRLTRQHQGLPLPPGD